MAAVCECAAAGWCERRQCRVAVNHWRRCQAGQVELLDGLYANVAAASAAGRGGIVAPVSLFGGRVGSAGIERVGDWLAADLKERFGAMPAGCDCRRWIARMNEWGVAGCRENLAEIVEHLFSEAAGNPVVSKWIRAALAVPVLGEWEGRRRIRNMVNAAIDKAAAVAKPGDTQERLAELLAVPAAGWPKGWRDWPNVMAWHRSRLWEAIEAANASEFPEGRFVGRGIVIPAGGVCRIYDRQNPQPYFWAAYAAAWVLRRRGCGLPIEFWFLPGEMEAVEFCELHARRVGAACRVLDVSGMRCVHGWQCKVNAVLQSAFVDVLYLDSDVICAADPEYLFESAEFRDNAALFWCDNPGLKDVRGWIGPDVWRRVGVNRAGAIRDIEAGQMVWSKRRGWRALQVAKHFADHADYWGGFNGGESGVWYGDKTDWHMGAILTETAHWRQESFKWNPGGFYAHVDSAGQLLFQHCCHRKGHLVNGHAIPNLIGNADVNEAARFRAPHEWMAGSVGDALQTINPERHFAMPEDDGGVSRVVFLDVIGRNEYRLPQRFQKSDVIVDVGANAGAFAWAAAVRGAGRVVAFEPNGDCAAMARENCRTLHAVEVVQAGVWRSDVAVETVQMGAHFGRSVPTSFSVVLSAAGERWPVGVVSLDRVLVEAGAVHILKLDCEGSEWPILFTSRELRRCEFIIGEYHSDAVPALAGDPPAGGWAAEWSPDGLRSFLESVGFELYACEAASSVHGNFWARRVG